MPYRPIEPPEIRGTGRTRDQMSAAPTGAIYVWCNKYLTYPQDLARSINRRDLKIIGPKDVDYHLQGIDTPVVVDHAAELNPVQHAIVRHLNRAAA